MPALTQEVDDDFRWYVEFRVMDRDGAADVELCLCHRHAPLVPRVDELFSLGYRTYKVIRVFHEVTRFHHTVKVTGEKI